MIDPVAAGDSLDRLFASRGHVRVDSPALQRNARNQQRAHLRRTYQDFVTEIGLTAEEANKFYDLLGAQQARGTMSQPTSDPALAALLGHSNLSAMKEYEATMNARQEVEAIRRELEFAALPLSDAQRKRLIKATMEEQQTHPFPLESPGMSPQDMKQQQLSWQREQAERLLSLTRPVLSAEQYELYEDTLRFALEMQEQRMLNPGKAIVFSNGALLEMTSVNKP